MQCEHPQAALSMHPRFRDRNFRWRLCGAGAVARCLPRQRTAVGLAVLRAPRLIPCGDCRDGLGGWPAGGAGPRHDRPHDARDCSPPLHYPVSAQLSLPSYVCSPPRTLAPSRSLGPESPPYGRQWSAVAGASSTRLEWPPHLFTAGWLEGHQGPGRGWRRQRAPPWSAIVDAVVQMPHGCVTAHWLLQHIRMYF